MSVHDKFTGDTNESSKVDILSGHVWGIQDGSPLLQVSSAKQIPFWAPYNRYPALHLNVQWSPYVPAAPFGHWSIPFTGGGHWTI